jgi:imidazolonepropionase-like amidohydrolase
VGGHKHILENRNTPDLRGSYELIHSGVTYGLEFGGKLTKPTLKATHEEDKLNTKVSYSEGQLQFSLSNDNGTLLRFSGVLDGEVLSGKLLDNSGESRELTLTRVAAYTASEKKESTSSTPEFYVKYPNVGHGYEALPEAQELLFKNATVWTGEEILENTDVHIRDQKIYRIGQNLESKKAQIIDATGKHLTAGIIDEHTHIGALAVNESGHNSTAEVRMADVVDPKDLDLYRNLAGGVTSAQLLHGSANPIGGQSALLRLKWGETADNLLFEGADGFIKFALGENVKQSNWQSFNRFPQTRMGVEQMIVDYFTRAKEYQQLKASKQPYRHDEELETLVEILESKRFITSHSYVQSEINMLMKVAEQFDFRINTFTHILEGYKVADKMAANGVGGSTFSDWWAYKYEVKDAIPYNAAIMTNAGVTVAINSDDAEMSRRLNQEAAKTMKYGGMTELEAWKTVTLNPAKLLHIDDQVGSIAVGKDADVVLWSGHPMSVYSKAEKTLIQGAVYFDITKDKALRDAIAQERMHLTKLMLDVKASGGATIAPVQTKKERFTCDTL